MCTNYNLQLLVDKLNQNNIKSLGIDYDKIKIFYNEENKEMIFNLINELKTKKTGLTFTSKFINNEKIKFVTINFRNKLNTNVDIVINLINNPIQTDISTYLYIDDIIDYYINKNINCTIEDNQDYKNNYLITLETITNEDDLNYDSFIINNNIENNLIHTICKPENNNKYKILYRALYETKEDLYSLLPNKEKVKKRTL